MNLLAFDTSTEALSIAVGRTDQVWSHSGVGGAQASATLIPAILRCLAQAGLRLAELDAIVFGRGPGAFTGLRTACAVAQGLAFGARPGGVPVLPVDSLLALAEEARHQYGVVQLVAVLDARMDQVYSAGYSWDGQRWSEPVELGLRAPQELLLPSGWAMAGNAFAAYGERLAAGAAGLAALPTAQALLRLAPELLAAGLAVPAEQALPRYIRDQVAQTTQQRADARAALAAAALA